VTKKTRLERSLQKETSPDLKKNRAAGRKRSIKGRLEGKGLSRRTAILHKGVDVRQKKEQGRAPSGGEKKDGITFPLADEKTPELYNNSGGRSLKAVERKTSAPRAAAAGGKGDSFSRQEGGRSINKKRRGAVPAGEKKLA